MPKPRNLPKTEEEWQICVDGANAFLLLHSAKCYGLITGGPEIDADRCAELLEEGEKRGFRPKRDPLEVVMEYNAEAAGLHGR